MLLPLHSRFWVLVAWLWLRLGVLLGVLLRVLLRGGGCRRGLGRVDELWNPCLDRLVGRQLGLGVEVEIASSPVESVDDGVVA